MGFVIACKSSEVQAAKEILAWSGIIGIPALICFIMIIIAIVTGVFPGVHPRTGERIDRWNKPLDYWLGVLIGGGVFTAVLGLFLWNLYLYWNCLPLNEVPQP